MMNRLDLTLRDGTVDDLDTVSVLISRAYEEFGPEVSPELAEAFVEDARRVHSALDESQLILGEIRGKTVGCVSLYLDGSTYAPGWPAEWPAVRLLAVDPDERRHGIATALMSECIDRARRHGASVLALHTTPFMLGAQRMYERMGFRRDPQIDMQWTPDLTVMGYRMQL